jgi:hypothetical protein
MAIQTPNAPTLYSIPREPETKEKERKKGKRKEKREKKEKKEQKEKERETKDLRLPIQRQHAIHIIIQIERAILILLIEPLALLHDGRDARLAFVRGLPVRLGRILLALEAIT